MVAPIQERRTTSASAIRGAAGPPDGQCRTTHVLSQKTNVFALEVGCAALITVLACMALQHDPWMFGLAVSICCVGCFVSIGLISRANRESDLLGGAWIILAATVIGTTAWSTHFTALLGFLSGADVGYDAAMTVASLFFVIAGSSLAIAVAGLRSSGPLPAIGGGLLGLTIAGMHYLGMLAYRVDASVSFDPTFVTVSLLLATVLGALSLSINRTTGHSYAGQRVAAALLICTIASLHFTGMAALRVVPLTATPAVGAHINVALALGTVAGAALIIIVGLLNFAIDRQSRRQAKLALARQARTDSLTELPNRLAAREELARRVQAAKPGEHFSILAMEISNIDAINQQLGSSIADRVIQATAQRLVEGRKIGVFLARLSGSQFCGIGIVEGREGALFRAQKVRASLSVDLFLEAHDVQVDVRIGAVTYPDDAEDAESMMRKAQVALARAVADPLEPVVLHDEQLDVAAKRRLALANDMRGALDRGEFELHYQPQVWIEGRRVIGYEALIRWRHPLWGMISPAEFIPMAERTGLILPIGEWVMLTACREAVKWPSDTRVAVNLSPLQLRQPNLTDCIAEALRLSGLEPERLEIELTESLLIDDRAHSLEIFRNIKALNVRLVLDDFGAGYSSMEVLRQFPFDKIKLDRSFVGELEANDQSRAILQAMLTLGRELSTPILVEGVETERQLAILKKYGCNKVQGYLTGRPIPSSAIRWQGPQLLSA